jgi:hypothetical protein
VMISRMAFERALTSIAQIPSTTGGPPRGVGDTEGAGEGTRLSPPNIEVKRFGRGDWGGGADMVIEDGTYTQRERGRAESMLSPSEIVDVRRREWGLVRA